MKKIFFIFLLILVLGCERQPTFAEIRAAQVPAMFQRMKEQEERIEALEQELELLRAARPQEFPIP